MATALTSTATTSVIGVTAIGFASAPIGGFNASAALGTATSATVELQVRVGATWQVADTLVLNGATPVLNAPVYPPYTAARWNVTAIIGGSIDLDAIGVGA